MGGKALLPTNERSWNQSAGQFAACFFGRCELPNLPILFFSQSPHRDNRFASRLFLEAAYDTFEFLSRNPGAWPATRGFGFPGNSVSARRGFWPLSDFLPRITGSNSNF